LSVINPLDTQDNIEDQYEALSRHILRKCNDLSMNNFKFGDINFVLKKEINDEKYDFSLFFNYILIKLINSSNIVFVVNAEVDKKFYTENAYIKPDELKKFDPPPFPKINLKKGKNSSLFTIRFIIFSASFFLLFKKFDFYLSSKVSSETLKTHQEETLMYSKNLANLIKGRNKLLKQTARRAVNR
jgi:hypothetical protein